jgi:hypothetical protein
MRDLETRLEQQEEEANAVIDKWQESCTASEEKCSFLETELAAAKKDLEASLVAQCEREDKGNSFTSDGQQQAFSESGYPEADVSTQHHAQLPLGEGRDDLGPNNDIIQQWEGRFLCSRPDGHCFSFLTLYWCDEFYPMQNE